MLQLALIVVITSLLQGCVITTSRDDASMRYTSCNQQTGLGTPLEVCSTAKPCRNLISRDPKLIEPSPVPKCHTNGGERGSFDDGAPKVWIDSDGLKRYYCSFDKSTNNRTPLIIFLHGATGTSQDLYTATSLRRKAEERGFMVVAPQARNLHWPNFPDGSHFDIYYRDPRNNPDFQFLDYLVDYYVSEKGAHPSMIYIVGWSNGAFFSSLYAHYRHLTPTPGGRLIAAASTYAGGDPFNNLSEGHQPTCTINPYPLTYVPTFAIARSCDSAVGCNEVQRQKFDRPPGFATKEWVAMLKALGSNGSRLAIIDHKGRERRECTAEGFCSKGIGLSNHVKWPDGIADSGNVDWEEPMIKFLFDNKLRE